MKIKRLVRHLLTPPWRMKRAFPPDTMRAIEAAIRESETTHYGEIRFAVEAALDPMALLYGRSARERAVEVFSQLRVWDTERNNGVLIYLLLADHRVEIVADRGIHRDVGQPGWEAICREMEHSFRQGLFEQGVVEGIRAVASHLVRHYPASGVNENELPDKPIVL
ncbi:membrane protein [Sulfuricella sp. T08]|uniref:TPM domain-containing protein n=1 Tax=Sulfuricella sp. T08 TaxID=1632857 RepID=UPI0006179F84|nr:TPM domain-containing protein [Sulfuricella sp. T08]GAO36340.1 membrane protein [Sulfuricella sp. T08]